MTIEGNWDARKNVGNGVQGCVVKSQGNGQLAVEMCFVTGNSFPKPGGSRACRGQGKTRLEKYIVELTTNKGYCEPRDRVVKSAEVS
jgi:hypothetical protein